ncbi:MAG: TonB family protein [Acidobacteriaceae bacterium]|nr:TonB family protein [Acidobacteriaceae bacterium]
MSNPFVTSEVEEEVRGHSSVTQPDAHLDRLLLQSNLEEPWYKSLVHNIRELVNPPKLPPLQVTSRPIEGANFGGLNEEPWYKSIVRNIRELVNPPKLPPLEVTSRPVEGADFGDLNKVEQPWFRAFFTNIKDLINPPKLPPLEVTSKPVEVGTIWGAYQGGETRSGAVSLAIHVAVIALLLVVFRKAVFTPQHKMDDATVIYLPEYKPKLPPAATKAGGGGGGGQKMPTPVSKGAPPKPAPKQFMPPALAVPKPKLPVVPEITAPAPPVIADNYGDPLSKLNQLSGGPGSQGLGTGKGGGVGSGSGDGYGPGSGGGTGGGAFRIGGDVSAPVLVSKVEPEYSEEARKAKFSGSVLLSIVVDANGNPRDIHVVRQLGLGLDEKAIEAVMRWRFRPGMKGGHPVATQAQVEVNFRLL